MNKIEYDNLVRLVNLRNASPSDANEIVAAYRKYINPRANTCTTCADSMREHFSQLKEWFNNNKQTLESTLSFVEASEEDKKKDVPAVKVEETKTEKDETKKRSFKK